MRYFIETSYKGTAYSGFQVQQNSNTIQAEIEKALIVFFKQSFSLTGSSRTDAGVHALQNYFHFDIEKELAHDFKGREKSSELLELEKSTYHLNAILPSDIVIKRIFRVADDAHCRFDAAAYAHTSDSDQYAMLESQLKDPYYKNRFEALIGK